MIHVIASVSIRQGRRSEFLEIFKANVPKVLAEQGCIEYRPAVDVSAGLDPQVSFMKRLLNNLVGQSCVVHQIKFCF